MDMVQLIQLYRLIDWQKKMIETKIAKLKNNLKQMGSVAVAYSAGVDSTFLLKMARDVLGEKAVAITVISESFPSIEETEAVEFLAGENIQHKFIRISQMDIDGFVANTSDRCYICKKAIFGHIKKAAESMGIEYVLDGTNIDDMGDYRPGMKALDELGVVSPLKDAGMGKKDIRELSKQLGLKTWDKPAYACLATRIQTGEQITTEKLSKIEAGEKYLMSEGFRQVRVRLRGSNTSIEVDRDSVSRLMPMESQVIKKLEELGLKNVSIDPAGYKMGNMNSQ